MRSAEPIACAPLEHADTTPYVCPCRPCLIATAAAAAFGMYCGMPSGETIFAPLSRITSCWVSTVSIPPIPVAMTQPTRSESYGQLLGPAGLAERLVGGHDGELREAVEPADLLDRQEVLGLEIAARAGAVDDPALAARPALVQRRGADAERRHGSHPGDDDLAPHDATRPGADQVDRVADGLELLHVLALEHDAVLVLDDLGQLDQVERVDVELLERGVARDLAERPDRSSRALR